MESSSSQLRIDKESDTDEYLFKKSNNGENLILNLWQCLDSKDIRLLLVLK
ncbi:hypothetical protein [uncultured Clostridium sp.]|uniref:hypothetical protein n=1 Tax=uncultured Clostridium sp. TaxID=59620 RepID=UPI0026341FD3|nr:hypothetical protein [uncultured Clostridium sp.]